MTTSDEVAPETDVEADVSAEELQAKATEVQNLRLEVEQLENERVQNEALLSNQLAMTQLQEEEARLRARLAQARTVVEQGAVEGGTSPLVSAKERMESAVRQQEAAEAAQRGEVYEPPVPEGESGPVTETQTPPEVPAPDQGQTPPQETPTVSTFGDVVPATESTEGGNL